MSLTPADLIAITKLAAPKDTRDKLLPGKYDVDTVIRVHGSMTVGEDYEQRIVAKADPWALFAALLEKIGTLESVGLNVNKLVEMAEKTDAEAIKKVKEAADEAIGKVKAATMTPCKGKVTAKVTFDEVVTEVVTLPTSAVPKDLLG